MHLFVYTSLSEKLREVLKAGLPAPVKPVFRNEVAKESSLDYFKTAELLLGNPPVAWFEQAAPNLAFWQLDSAGFDQYRQVKTKAQVANMGDFFARPCAETMVGGILAFYRGLDELIRKQPQKEWIGNKMRERLNLLSDKNVIILGAGAIGQAVKQMLAGFNCLIKMTARQNPLAELHTWEEVLAALPEADLVINTLPGGAEKYVSAEFLAAMQAGSLYASVGRGSTTDEEALIAALQAGKLAGAVLDVTATEPLPPNNPLWEMENVILTQHSAGGQKAEDEGKISQFLSNVSLFVAGKPIQNKVELAQGY